MSYHVWLEYWRQEVSIADSFFFLTVRYRQRSSSCFCTDWQVCSRRLLWVCLPLHCWAVPHTGSQPWSGRDFNRSKARGYACPRGTIAGKLYLQYLHSSSLKSSNLFSNFPNKSSVAWTTFNSNCYIITKMVVNFVCEVSYSTLYNTLYSKFLVLLSKCKCNMQSHATVDRTNSLINFINSCFNLL